MEIVVKNEDEDCPFFRDPDPHPCECRANMLIDNGFVGHQGCWGPTSKSCPLRKEDIIVTMERTNGKTI